MTQAIDHHARVAESRAGTAAIAVIGILFFREDVSAVKLVSIGLIVVGVMGVNLGGVRH